MTDQPIDPNTVDENTPPADVQENVVEVEDFAVRPDAEIAKNQEPVADFEEEDDDDSDS